MQEDYQARITVFRISLPLRELLKIVGKNCHYALVFEIILQIVQ